MHTFEKLPCTVWFLRQTLHDAFYFYVCTRAVGFAVVGPPSPNLCPRLPSLTITCTVMFWKPTFFQTWEALSAMFFPVLYKQADWWFVLKSYASLSMAWKFLCYFPGKQGKAEHQQQSNQQQHRNCDHRKTGGPVACMILSFVCIPAFPEKSDI